MRVIALLAAYNEERYIANCLELLGQQGVEAYLIDNESTDRTVAIAEGYRGRGLVGLETKPRHGRHSLREMLERKEELAAKLKADWFIHMDLDEVRLPPRSGLTLAQAFQEVEAQGYNAVNFHEFVFVPTQESPNHDHRDYLQTMRWYYPYLPENPHRLNAWRHQSRRVDLSTSGGHRVSFPGVRPSPIPFLMRHYHFLNIEHAASKLTGLPYVQADLARGWHGWRALLRPEMITLPRQAELRTYISDDDLDPSNPRLRHHIEECFFQYLPSEPSDLAPQTSDPTVRLAELENSIVQLKKRNAQLENQLQAANFFWGEARREVKFLQGTNFYKAARLYWLWRDRVQTWLNKFPR